MRFFAFVAATLALADQVAVRKKEDAEWLATKVKEEGVTLLPSGMAYKVVESGSGGDHPLASTQCDCHYEGKTIDGNVFDSSYKRGEPTAFAPNQVIKGWTEALQMMVEGDKWELYIPSELAYGDSGAGGDIPGGATLIFQIELVKIKGPSVPALKCLIDDTEKCSEKEVKFIEKMKAYPSLEGGFAEEFARLTDMKAKNDKTRNMSKKNREWLERRLRIMNQFKEKDAKKEEL